MTLPNKITIGRLLVAVVIFVFLTISVNENEHRILFLDITFGLFLIAAFSDYLDGYIARKYNLMTTFGRIADPFVDKIFICGMFICLIPYNTTLVQPWMVVIIIGREFLVSG